jgi:hypothetical protein
MQEKKVTILPFEGRIGSDPFVMPGSCLALLPRVAMLEGVTTDLGG